MQAKQFGRLSLSSWEPKVTNEAVHEADILAMWCQKEKKQQQKNKKPHAHKQKTTKKQNKTKNQQHATCFYYVGLLLQHDYNFTNESWRHGMGSGVVCGAWCVTAQSTIEYVLHDRQHSSPCQEKKSYMDP